MPGGPSIPEEEAYQHLVQLLVVRALLGQITPEMHGISVDFDGEDHLTLHFALTYDYERFDEDVIRILFKVEGQFSSVPILPVPRMHVVKHIGDAGRYWPGYAYPRVYVAKTFGDPDNE